MSYDAIPIPEVKREVDRKARNRKRRQREHLEQARHEPPCPYRRVRQLQYRAWHGVETYGDNRARRRQVASNGHYGGRRPGWILTQLARGERRRQRAHRRRMARR